METPSSTRRVTRSQTKAAAAASATTINNIPISKRFEESEKKAKQGNGKQKERSALIDITNDSPIIGLAMVTPSSTMSKKKRVMIGQITPGSGEALLRGQVKNLLQKVEEEADDLCKVSLDLNRPLLHLQGFVNSPLRLLAPTPANTPHLNPSENGLPSVTPSPVEEKIIISQMIIGKKESETEESNVTRSLLLDFSEKSEGTDDVSSDCSSMLTYEGGIRGSKNAGDDDVSSIWSIQANAKLCRGISKIGINGAAKFAGKHTRFVYNSDGELEGEEEESGGGDDHCRGVVAAASPPSALRLKGLPTPKGKHLRFPEEEN
nr:acidic leucine-rich nuclear phosphoprotein 32 family member A-like [Ipomoea batatas]